MKSLLWSGKLRYLSKFKQCRSGRAGILTWQISVCFQSLESSILYHNVPVMQWLGRYGFVLKCLMLFLEGGRGQRPPWEFYENWTSGQVGSEDTPQLHNSAYNVWRSRGSPECICGFFRPTGVQGFQIKWIRVLKSSLKVKDPLIR